MSRSPKQAEAALEKQIGMLGNLRNAGTRAQEFREWRQATLTLIERIWPDQPTRAQRFRRIPFSVASAMAEDRVARDAFERGCGEARRLLHLWLTEISVHGVRMEPDAPRLTEAVRAAFVEQHQPIVEETQLPKPAPRVRKRKQKLSEMLGFEETGGIMQTPPLAIVPQAAAGTTQPVAPATALTAPAIVVPEALSVAARGAVMEDALAVSIDHAIERALHETLPIMETRGEKVPTPEAAEESSLRTRPIVSYVARAFISMAADLEELGVPESHRDRVRLALLDLAHHLDCGSVTWHLMRDAVTLVMHYPALGRQALPLLLPYLENAA